MRDKIKEKINNDVKDKIPYCKSGYAYKMDPNIFNFPKLALFVSYMR